MPQHTIVIRVEFPALDSLVQFLQGNQQAQIDATTAQVQQLTASLKQSTDVLQGAIAQETA